jgi:hypothetical protein
MLPSLSLRLQPLQHKQGQFLSLTIGQQPQQFLELMAAHLGHVHAGESGRVACGGLSERSDSPVSACHNIRNACYGVHFTASHWPDDSGIPVEHPAVGHADLSGHL